MYRPFCEEDNVHNILYRTFDTKHCLQIIKQRALCIEHLAQNIIYRTLCTDLCAQMIFVKTPVYRKFCTVSCVLTIIVHRLQCIDNCTHKIYKLFNSEQFTVYIVYRSMCTAKLVIFKRNNQFPACQATPIPHHRKKQIGNQKTFETLNVVQSIKEQRGWGSQEIYSLQDSKLNHIQTVGGYQEGLYRLSEGYYDNVWRVSV